jgi:hypothetical protein
MPDTWHRLWCWFERKGDGFHIPPPTAELINTSSSLGRWCAPDLRVPPRQSHLVWVRRELVRGKSFLVADCYPTGREKLPIPTKTSFSRDLWSVKTGVATFAQVVKMIGGGEVLEGLEQEGETIGPTWHLHLLGR